jgi:hypothetical protein
VRHTLAVRGVFTILAFAAGFAAIISLRQARAPFGMWSRATGAQARAFLPAVWWRLTMNCEAPPELEKARRDARLWIGLAMALLVAGLSFSIAAAIVA